MKPHLRSLTESLSSLHDLLQQHWPDLSRVAVALYDDQTDMLHTFAKSSPEFEGLKHYAVPLSSSTSLQTMAHSGEPRVIQDLSLLDSKPSEHSQQITANFKSSYTAPFYLSNKLLGFVFFDAKTSEYFSPELVTQLQTYTRFIESLAVSDVFPVKALIGLLGGRRSNDLVVDQAATPNRLIRIASYLEVLAQSLAEQHGFSDEQIEYMWCYAPLYDIGHVTTPDHVLMSPSLLTGQEYRSIKRHIDQGLEIIDLIEHNVAFQQLQHMDILRGIVTAHQERWDGSGYPEGLRGEAIPIVGRMMAVVDVFDALSSNRIYRKAWPMDEVKAFFQKHRGEKFDPVCVDALLANQDKLQKIATAYQDEMSYMSLLQVERRG